MNIDCLPFSSLPFSKLFNSYINGDKSLKPFFEVHPFDKTEVEKHLTTFRFSGNREETVSWLTDYHAGFSIPAETKESIKKMADSDALAVVTGQQCTVMGGPLFTVYKIVTTIEKARQWEKTLDRPVIPVFWIADEDHDFDEAAQTGIPAGENLTLLKYDDRSAEGEIVASIPFSEEISRVKSELKTSMFETDFSDNLWEIVDALYKPGNTFGKAFGQLVLDLFGKYGLILAGSNNRKAKKLVADTMIRGISDSESHFNALSEQSDKLTEAGFKNQVYLNQSNLFYLDKERKRIKIQFENDRWVVPDSDTFWTSKELTKEIENSPEKFSPNVFLRPVIQDQLLPVVTYVAGPGEIAYYSQMKTFYHQFDMKMPIITPRFSATLVESGIERIMQKLPFSIPDYSGRIEDLEAEFIEKSSSPDIEKIFGMWQNGVRKESKKSINEVAEIDPTLKKSAEKSLSLFFNELERLKGKVYKSLKDSEKTQINRIEKIKLSLFPNRNLQEREVAYIYFMNKYGTDLWDRLLEKLKDEKPDTHKIIYL